MKKFSIILRTGALLLLSLILMNSYAYASSTPPILGDVNTDEKVTSEDARIILRYSCNLCNLHDYLCNRADMDNDGKVSPADARLALRRSVNLDKINYSKIEEEKWVKTRVTVFYADECGGENYNTSTVENILLSVRGIAVPNSSKHVSKNDENIVTYYGYNVLGTTNRSIFPIWSVIEYKIGDKYFYGVILDHNNDNMGGNSLVTLDHLFCSYSEGTRFINKYTPLGENLPTSQARVIGKMNYDGSVTFN